MKEASHGKVTTMAFDLLSSIEPSFPKSFYRQKYYVAKDAVNVDFVKDLEIVAVLGRRDDPHRSERLVVDDVPFTGGSLTCLNHYIDIRKNDMQRRRGKFDDYDGYSYYHGSASKDEHEGVIAATVGDRYGLKNDRGMLGSALGKVNNAVKVDSALNLVIGFNKYVHAPGQRWYRGCSPSIERYSFFKDKRIYSNVQSEAKKRFPLAQTIPSANCGIPYSVFMPVDNMARYWYNYYISRRHRPALGYVLHAIQDASIPHHAAACCGNWHQLYEQTLNQRIRGWFQQARFRNGIKSLYNRWNRIDRFFSTTRPLWINDWRKTPASNWRIDFLVTWMALNAYNEYKTTNRNFRSWRFSDRSAQELTQKATAISMLFLKNVMK